MHAALNPGQKAVALENLLFNWQFSNPDCLIVDRHYAPLGEERLARLHRLLQTRGRDYGIS